MKDKIKEAIEVARELRKLVTELSKLAWDIVGFISIILFLIHTITNF